MLELLSLLLAAWAGATVQQQQPAQQPAPAVQSSGRFIVAGTVTNATTGDPISRADVTLTPQFRGPIAQTVTTNATGSFAFTGVVAGRYTLGARRRGFTAQTYLEHGPLYSAVLVGPDFDTANLALHLPGACAITGHVYDEFGEPVRHAQLSVFFRDESGAADTPVPRGQAQTDDEGQYRIGRLQAGVYFVGVNVQPWYARHPQTMAPPMAQVQARMARAQLGVTVSSDAAFGPPNPRLDVVYEFTFFGGATDLASAQAIRLMPGDTQSADITLNPVPARHIRLVTGDSNQYPNVMVRSEGTPPIPFRPVQAYPIEPGVWELAGVPPGKYLATLRSVDSQTRTQRAENFELGPEPEVNAASAAPGVTVRGQLTGESGFQPAGSHILLTPSGGGNQFNADVSPAGEFEFREKVMAGTYVLVVNGGNVTHYLTHLTATGARVSGRHVEIGTQDANLSLTVSGNFAQYSGFASRDGKHAAGILVAMVPMDAATRDISPVRLYQTDADGSYAFRNVLPGTYSLIAVENVWDMEYNNADFLKQFSAKGRSIVAEAGADKTFDLAVQDAKAALNRQ